jgi:hypothetical protein
MGSLVSNKSSSFWPSLNSLRTCYDDTAFVRDFALGALQAPREFLK